MYQRNYNLPPNYNGTAFNQIEKEEPKPLRREPGKEQKLSLSQLNTESDDLLLGALIIMLMQSHADDELLIILTLLLLT